MEFTTLDESMDLVAEMFSCEIFPDFEVSRRLLWQMLFSYHCFANEFCHYLNDKTPGLIPPEFFDELPEEPILPIVIPINKYKNARLVSVLVNDFDARLDELIARIEKIVSIPSNPNSTGGFIPKLYEHRVSSNLEFGLPPTPSHIHQWRKNFPYHEWLKLKSEHTGVTINK